MANLITKSIVDELNTVKRHEEETLAQNRAQEMGVQYLNLDSVPMNISDLILIPEEKARETKTALVKKDGRIVSLAALHPDAPLTKEIIKEFEDQILKVNLIAVSLSSLEHAWEKYSLYHPSGEELRKVYIIHEDRTAELTKVLKSKPQVEKELAQIKEEDTSSFLDILFIGAIQANANDIHIEPEEKGAKVRLRIDGVLQDIRTITPRLFELALDRVKILAELQLNVRQTGQDGRFTIRRQVEGKNNDIEVRLALIPSYFGQTIVMRLLGVAVSLLDIKKLGMEEHQQEMLIANLSLPNGMILTTGPTGSGKTTLLYAALNYVKKPEINIITIEDPVEYKIEGITQTQVHNDKGFTFEKGLQSILRQDPNVVLVGEIRSEETAETAINAALTGHLVFSTLHTNDAPGAIERFLNLKVRIHLIPAAVRLIVAQRLVRKLCSDCKKNVPLPEDAKESIKQVISLISPRSHIEIPLIPENMYLAQGCEKCFGTGYTGRVGIFELLELDDYVEQKILANATTFELRKAAIENGMLTLLQHGILKFIQGITSLEEIQRIAGDAQYIEELYGQAVLSILSKTLAVPDTVIEQLKAVGAYSPASISKFFASLDEEKLVQAMVAFGILADASDIHLEPKEKEFQIKYRIDGVLQEMAALRSEIFSSFIERIREMAGMKIGVHKRIQEGRFSAVVGVKQFHIDVRVSLIPGGYGETVVMRILKQEFTFSLETLGIRAPLREQLVRELHQPNGLILATGPTGAGKTTTLYSILRIIADGKKKIITIENPIEYKIPEIIQTQVDPEAGYDFPDAIRAILRQDPDIILVGEIRDNLTAKTAFQAASTGHLVFSTLHTNDALGVLDRLYSLDMPAEEVTAILNVILAQRLVRLLCPACKKPMAPSGERKEKILSYISQMPEHLRPSFDQNSFTLFEPVGCDQCNNTGYKGRIGIFEIVFMSEQLKVLIRDKATRAQLVEEARKTHSLFFKEDAAAKLVEGLTSMSEVEETVGSL